MNIHIRISFLACSFLLLTSCAAYKMDEPFDMDREEQICNNLQTEFPLNHEDITEMASVMRSYDRNHCAKTLSNMTTKSPEA